MIKRIINTLIASVLFFAQTLFAENTPEAERTIMIYIVASDLESFGENATFNIHQILNANFSKDEKVKVVIMTGGTWEWYLAGEYLYDPANPDGPTEVSAEYNQIWEAKGADSVTYQENGHGKMVLLDRDGISGDGVNAKTSMEELMSDPNTLKGFINYAVQNFPAKKYGLVLWNHGGGVIDGYGMDEHSIDLYSMDVEPEMMSFAGIVDALSDNDVIRTVGKFDFINFDACLMNSVELNLALADLTDYYIASAETEPSYGQDYNGWLNALGEDPTINTFELGKVVVDDFMKFYEELHEGQITLAVVDMQKLMASNFLPALVEMNTILQREVRNRGVDGSFLYYDELNSFEHSVHYYEREETKRDLRTVAAQLPIITKEVSANNLDENGVYTLLNDYSDSSKKIVKVLTDNTIIYSRASDEYVTEARPYLDEDGEIHYGPITSSGMYIYFPAIRGVVETIEYYNAITNALPFIQNQERREFLSNYLNTVLDYTLLTESGNAVAALIDNGVAKNEINFNKVKEYWQGITVSNGEKFWDYAMSPIINARGEVIAWLEEIIEQQRGDAVSVDSVTVKKIVGRNNNGYQIKIDDTDKRIIETVKANTDAELPAAVPYFETFFGNQYQLYRDQVGFHISEANAVQDTSGLHRDLNDPIEKLLSDYLKWYSEKNSIWNYMPEQEKVYAIKDPNGTLHAADVSFDNAGVAVVYGEYMDDNIPNRPPYKRGVTLFFIKEGNDYKLFKFIFSIDRSRPVMADDLHIDLHDFKTVYNLVFHGISLTPPLSSTTFDITKDNASLVKLVEVEADELADIADTDNDGEKLKTTAVVKDMYHHEIDISRKFKDAEDEEALLNIDLADVESVPYNGKEQGPRVVHNGKVLQENVDYTFNWAYDTGACVNVGPCQVMLIGKGKYAGWINVEYDIYPKAIDPEIELSEGSYIYNGSEVTPAVTVKDGETVLGANDYTVTYADGRKNVGEYAVTVELKGNYTGTASTTFQINPKGTSIKKFKRWKNAITVVWKKQELKMADSRITGYQIELSPKRDFSVNKRTVNVKGFKKIQRKIAKLQSDKKYFVRLRTYKKINDVTLFSGWTRVRAVKTAD